MQRLAEVFQRKGVRDQLQRPNDAGQGLDERGRAEWQITAGMHVASGAATYSAKPPLRFPPILDTRLLLQQQIRTLHQLFEPLQEPGRRSAVHNPVIEREAQRHHLTDRDLALTNDRLRGDAPYT